METRISKTENLWPVNRKRHERKNRIAKTETVFQMEVTECGAASLAMVMGYYGANIPLEELRVATGVSRNGVNAKNICLAAEKYGFSAHGFSRSTDRLLEVTAMPCVIHWEFDHFVVLEGFKDGIFYVNDPAQGHRKLKREEFDSSFTGVVLEILPTERVVKRRTQNLLLNFSIKRLAEERRTLTALLLLGLCLIVPGVLMPVFSQVFLDEILVNAQHTWTKWLLLIMLLTCIFECYFKAIQGRLTYLLRTKMVLYSSDELLHHLLRLPMSFFEQRLSGDLLMRVQNNVSVNEFLISDLLGVVIGLATSLIYLLIMTAYNFKLMLLGVGFSIAALVAVTITTRRIENLAKKYGQDQGQMSGALYSGLAVSETIKSSGCENDYASKMMGYCALVEKTDQRLGWMQQYLDVIPQAIQAFNNVAVIIAGSTLVLDGSFTPGMLMAFTGMLGSFSTPFSKIVSFSRRLQQVKNDMNRVNDLMGYEADAGYSADRSTDWSGTKLSGDIQLKDVSFAYGELDKNVIKKFNMHLEPGKSVALVGKSGCGKSTVAKLISSLYQPKEGEILFDGRPIMDISREEIAASISVVSQEIVLFEGSVYDNITVWNAKVSQEDVIQAAKDACIHNEITSRPGSYDYKLTDNGENLSGGQRQRIEIARALVTNPSILILDEATSALDAITEQQVYENIKKRACTTVIVAQRISSIQDCDEIIVMERGRIAERGTHSELMMKKGKYYELVQSRKG